MKRRNTHASSRRSGMVIVFTILIMTILIGIAAMAVDLARYQTVMTELHRAAEAAARAGVANLSAGTTTASSAATTMASNNVGDGLSLSSSNATVTVTYLNWTSSSSYTVESGASGANAMKVTISEKVPLLFASILGFSKTTATESATALLTTYTETPYVAATSDPWLAGQPTGTLGSEPDPGYWATTPPGQESDHHWEYDIAGPNGGSASTGQSYSSPVQLTIPIIPGSTIEVSNTSGLANNDNGWAPTYGPDGESSEVYNDGGATNTSSPGYTGAGNTNSASTATGSEHGIANANIPLNAMVGVFLDANVPDTEDSSMPPGLDFSSSSSQTYTEISPQLRQPIFVGDGQGGGSTQQEIIVPQGATRMFLGTMDGWEWDNNVGGFNATITETAISIVQ